MNTAGVKNNPFVSSHGVTVARLTPSTIAVADAGVCVADGMRYMLHGPSLRIRQDRAEGWERLAAQMTAPSSKSRMLAIVEYIRSVEPDMPASQAA